MKLHTFGTCAGTLPNESRHHMSFALELTNGIYWFDAGETCSYTAHLMGVDLLKIKSIFISHTHMDHIGGLGNLMWNMRKLSCVQNRQPDSAVIDPYIPVLPVFNAIMQILSNTEGNFETKFSFSPHTVTDGVLYKGRYDDITVIAHHNNHIRHKDGEPWKSFSYEIIAENKRILYSGDTELNEVLNLLDGKFDCFMMETGHYDSYDVIDALVENNKQIDTLFFNHNGRNILVDRDAALRQAESAFNGKVIICEDGMTYQL